MATGVIDIEVVGTLLTGMVSQMQNSLFRTGFSSVIRESHDGSCALLDATGRVLAQYVVNPLHLGAFTACTQAILARYSVQDIYPGDAFLINHPYIGGSPHAADVAVITPIFLNNFLAGFAATMAHKTDIGGASPGSCPPQARDIFAEGIQIPPVRFIREGKNNEEVIDLIKSNTRTPELLWGDLRCQIGSCRLGERLLADLAATYGPENTLRMAHQYAERTALRVRSAILSWPDGSYEATRYVDNDGIRKEHKLKFVVIIRKKGDKITFDFSSSDDQAQGPANIRPSMVRAACAFCITCFISPDLPINYGLLESFEIVTRPGTVVDPVYPAPVNYYNPTVHALEEATFAALAPIMEKRIAGGGGSRTLLISGIDPRTERSFVMYEIFGSGSGARSDRDGVNSTTVNHSNAQIAPIEIIETEFPVRINRFELIKDSGGQGTYRGGLGFHRDYEILAHEVRVTIRSDKHIVPPEGVLGGKKGRPARSLLKREGEETQILDSRISDLGLKRGDVLSIETPGGGGLGDPSFRDKRLIERDLKYGYISDLAGRGEKE